ncbi:branched-chain amino acid ABC transporter permease [Phytohabitans aurantiacus]|jgi:branched-chain amino acid transport system permease protein|uniref:Branched-chain amino acid ABC transporter permease n=1 Tax=Phytohabitans aurantiacus TaxID=3016789 RepID=A0ABQ5QR28_9ACTN|nr:branched-chain amino acid ABC transporter permease [Phytohabitans aurantiacus]
MKGIFVDFDALFGHLGQHTVDGLSKGSIYALVALGYTLVYGVLRLINFAHSEVFMIGTFTVVGTWSVLGATDSPAIGTVILLLLAGLVAAAAVSGATAVAVERVAYRRLRRMNAPPLIFLITAIGLSLVLSEAFGIWQGRLVKGMPTVIERSVLFTIGNTEVTNVQVITVLAALIMMFGLDVFINRTRYGRGVRAVAQDPDTAALMGVNKDRVIALIFLLGGLLAGAAALLYCVRYGNTRFNVGFVLGLKAFTAAVLGGIGNLRGALLGGLLLGVVEVYAATLTSSAWEDVAAFVVLVVVLLFRPTGLLGESLGRARA